uniref:Gag-pol polyprotein n=1 Tax=Solanum tuberosum TaxID=4113 RepID=M1D8Z2_SOLTU
MSVEEYALKFSMLSRYALSLVSNSREKMSKFVITVREGVLEEGLDTWEARPRGQDTATSSRGTSRAVYLTTARQSAREGHGPWSGGRGMDLQAVMGHGQLRGELRMVNLMGEVLVIAWILMILAMALDYGKKA